MDENRTDDVKTDDVRTDHEATASDSPLIQGRNARLYGKPATQCPYGEGTPERAAWMESYEAGSPASAGVDAQGNSA